MSAKEEKKDTIRLEVTVKNPLRVEIVEGERCLVRDIDQLEPGHVLLKTTLVDVDPPVERRAPAPLGHDRQFGVLR